MSTVTNTTVTNVNVDNKQTKNKKTSEPKADKKPRAPKAEKKLEEPVVVQEEPKTDDAEVPVEKKARAATLPAKYAKFIQFGFWFLKKLNENSDVPAIDEALFNEKLKLFAEVDEQQAFVQEFFDASKDMNKDIRLLLLQRKRDAAKAAKAEARATAKAEAKAAKAIDAPPKKPRAPRQKKEASDDEVVAKKPPTKGKKKVLKSDDAFVNEMVQLANGDTTSNDLLPTEQPVETPKVEKPKAEKPPKVQKTKAEKPPKVDKPKANKKTDKNKPDDPSDNLQVSILNLNDKQYLIDDDNNVYDFNSHDICGKFDPSNQTLVPI
jgi:hypothetical protein